MPTPDLSSINSFFETVRNQFDPAILSRQWTSNPYAGLVESKPYDSEMGLIQTVVTATHELPTNYGFDGDSQAGVALTLSNGTGNAACSPAVSIIQGGYTNRDFQLYAKAFETPPFCLTDLQFKFQWAQQARAFEKALADYVTQWQGDWNRRQNIGMINTKVSTTGTGVLSTDINSDYDFSDLSVPTVLLDWEHLAQMYDQLTVIAAEQNAVGYSDGQPCFSLNVGPGLKRYLFQGTDKIRTSVNFLDQGKEYSRNFLARGITTAVNGFMPNVDMNAVRYTAGLVPVYPWINDPTTVGNQAIRNPAYRTVPNGGTAVYEAFSVMARGIYSKRPRPVGMTSQAMESFNPISYVGNIVWINNPDMGYNKQGNYGFYRIDIQQAAMPEFPELGFAGITLAKDGGFNT